MNDSTWSWADKRFTIAKFCEVNWDNPEGKNPCWIGDWAQPWPDWNFKLKLKIINNNIKIINLIYNYNKITKIPQSYVTVWRVAS